MDGTKHSLRPDLPRRSAIPREPLPVGDPTDAPVTARVASLSAPPRRTSIPRVELTDRTCVRILEEWPTGRASRGNGWTARVACGTPAPRRRAATSRRWMPRIWRRSTNGAAGSGRPRWRRERLHRPGGDHADRMNCGTARDVALRDFGSPVRLVQDGSMASTATLVLLRHGESEWNATNLFTGLGRRRPDRKGPGRGAPWRRAAAPRLAAARRVHTSLLRRAIRTAEHRAGRRRPVWLPVRRSWRLNERHYGALQGKDKAADAGGVRRRAVHALAPLLRRAAAAAGRRRRVLPGRRPALRRPAGGAAPDRVPGRRGRRGCCRTGTTRSCPTCGPAGPCWWPRTATRCGRWSSTWTGCPTRPMVGLNIPTGIPLLVRAGRHDASRSPSRRPLPRPGRRAPGRSRPCKNQGRK